MNRLLRTPSLPTRHKHHAIAALPLLAAGHAAAGELTFGALTSGLGQGRAFDLGAAQLTVQGVVQAGAVARASSAHHTGAYQAMTTLDDGDLNYGRNDLVSSALESWLQADLRAGGAGVFVSGKGWYGYSYDGIFAQGRKTGIAEVKATWRKSWTFAASFLKTGGGTYNIVDDRSFYSASAGYKF